MKKLRLGLAVFPSANIRSYFWASSENDVRGAISDNTRCNAYQEHGEIKLAQKAR